MPQRPVPSGHASSPFRPPPASRSEVQLPKHLTLVAPGHSALQPAAVVEQTFAAAEPAPKTPYRYGFLHDGGIGSLATLATQMNVQDRYIREHGTQPLPPTDSVIQARLGKF